jgi:hypothetical protein
MAKTRRLKRFRAYLMPILLTVAFPVLAAGQSAVSLKDYKNSKQILRFVGTYMIQGVEGDRATTSVILEDGSLRIRMICTYGQICNIPPIPLERLGQSVRNAGSSATYEYRFEGDSLTCQVTKSLSRWTRVVRRIELKLSGDDLVYVEAQVFQRRKFLSSVWLDEPESSDGYRYAYGYKGYLVKVSNQSLSNEEMLKISDRLDVVKNWIRRQHSPKPTAQHEVIDLTLFQKKQTDGRVRKKRSQSAEIIQFPGTKNTCEEDLTPRNPGDEIADPHWKF